MNKPLLRLVAAGVLLGTPGLLTYADAAHPAAAASRVLTVTHLWADANGVSHFRDEKLSFEAATPENPTAGTTSRTNPDPEALVSLPLRGRIESLGVSAAAAVLLYEVARGRGGGPAGAQ